MQYRDFGRTGWKISEISFGAWQLGGQWGNVDDRESVRTLLASYAGGVNFVDTAQLYGGGHSERVVGQSLREWKGRPIRVATKIPPTTWPDAADDDPEFAPRYPARYLRDRVEDSLRRLGIECIDLLQLHCWMPSGLKDLGWLDTLHSLRDEGKIDRIGVSIRDYRPEDGLDLAHSGLVDAIQVIYNIFEQEPAAALFPVASDSGTAIVARVALDSGALSGTWTPETLFGWEEGSVLRTMFRDDRFTQTLERVAGLSELTTTYYDTLAEAAIRFVLGASAVSTTVIGMSNAHRLAWNLSLSDGAPFPEELRLALAEHTWRRNFYV